MEHTNDTALKGRSQGEGSNVEKRFPLQVHHLVAGKAELCDYLSPLLASPYADSPTSTLLVVTFCGGNAIADIGSTRAPGGLVDAAS